MSKRTIYKSVEEMMAIVPDNEIMKLGLAMNGCLTNGMTWLEAKYKICEDFLNGKSMNIVED